ncbi:MAG: efflux RND transporter periplasmic adaptor subunit [Gemmataceae bacterium]
MKNERQNWFRAACCGVAFLLWCGMSGPVADAEEEEGHAKGDVIELSPEMLTQLGLKVATAGPTKLTVTLTLTGKLVPLEDRVAHVTPRFPGVIREVRKRLGDAVARGETLAVVESNQTLQPYEVKSQIPGMIVLRHATLGESVTDASVLFDVADYGELFADLFVFPSDFSRVHLGQRALIRFPDGSDTVSSSITFLSPITDAETQSRFIRAVLPNPTARYQPGMFVTGDIVLEEAAVGTAVEATALRTAAGRPVVFVEREPGRFVPRGVVLGRRDKDSVEILSGLRPGERYAAGSTFILQAELEKGEAEHDD